MRVWVTRTEPGASRLRQRLARTGYSVLKAPVLRIEDTLCAAPAGCFDFVLFVSGHAVERAFASGWGADLRPGVAAGIGTAADAALRSRGVQPRLCGLANARAATAAMGEPPPRTLLVKGEGGRDVVQDWVRSHGASLAVWDVYRRLPAKPSLGGERVDVIVAASGDGVREIAKLWSADRRSSSVALLVPSARVARLAAASGFDNVIVTCGVADDVVVTALAELRETEVG